MKIETIEVDGIEYITQAGAAKLLGVSRQSINQRLSTGSIPYVVVGGRKMIRMSLFVSADEDTCNG